MATYDFDTVYNRKGTGCFKADALQMMYGKEDLLSLWVADMDFAIAPEILEAMQERLKHPIFGYNYRPDAYYEAIIHWIKSRYNWQTEKGWMLSTPGIVTAINIAVQLLTKPCNYILVQTPVYDPFFHAVHKNDRRLLTNPLKLVDGRYEIDWEDFEQKLKDSSLYILCNPHNPVGRVWTEDELLQIGRLCRQYKVPVVTDEIHADIVYAGNKHITFASLEDFAEFTISCYSPSKSFNLAGLCTSVIIIPNEQIRQTFNEYIMSMHLFLGNTFGIVGLQTAYTKGANWLNALVQYLEHNRDYLCTFIAEQIPGLKIIKPEGTYLAWIDFTALNLTDGQFYDRLVNQANLALSMGKTYGEDGRGFVRLNFACPKSVLKEACNRMKDTFNKG